MTDILTMSAMLLCAIAMLLVVSLRVETLDRNAVAFMLVIVLAFLSLVLLTYWQKDYLPFVALALAFVAIFMVFYILFSRDSPRINRQDTNQNSPPDDEVEQ